MAAAPITLSVYQYRSSVACLGGRDSHKSQFVEEIKKFGFWKNLAPNPDKCHDHDSDTLRVDNVNLKGDDKRQKSKIRKRDLA